MRNDPANTTSAVNKEAKPSHEGNVDEIVPLPRLRTNAQSPGSSTSRSTSSKHSGSSNNDDKGEKQTRPSAESQHRSDQRLNPDPDTVETGGKFEQDADQSGLDEFWLLSTGFPLISATFGPVANLFSICALVESWRVLSTDAHDRLPDPPWALAINGLSLALGIFANVSLLLTFLRRVSYHVSQPFTVIAWLTSAALLIALVIAYIHTPLNPKNLENVTWSQSYYYAIISATLYLFISLLLIGNLWGAYVQAHYPPGLPGLTAPQRSLMIQSILYMCYLGAGAALFGHLEGWRFLDAIYWADYTLLTVGIGSDFSPKTTAGRIAIVPYAWGGIITVGLVIAGVRALVIEKGKGKLRLRTVRRGKAVVARAVRKRWAPHTKNGEQGVENVLQRNDGEEQEHGKNDVRDEAISRDFNREVAGVRSKAKKKTEWVGLASAFAAYLLLWLGGAAAFFAFESAQKWTYGDALYFTNIALLTIGYGDLYPQSQAGKPFFVVWSLLAVPTVTVLISSLQDTLLSGLRGFMERLGRKKDIGPPDEDALSEEEKGLEDEGECEPGPGRSDTRSYNRGHDDEGIKEK